MEPMRRKLCIKNMSFYYVEGMPSTIVGLKNIDAITQLTFVKQYVWLDRNQERTQELRDKINEVRVISVATIQECKQEVEKIQKVNIICTDFDLLLRLEPIVSSAKNVQTVYFFSFDCLSDEQAKCEQMIKSGKLGSKFVTTYQSELEEKLTKKSCFPNFLFFGSDNRQSSLQKASLNLAIQQKFDHQIMVKNMERLIKSVTNSSEADKVKNFIESLKSAQRSYNDFGRTIRFYTDQSFLYRLVNNLMRKGYNPTELFYIQPYVKNLFYAIYQLFLIQKGQKKYQWMQQYVYYRAAKFSSKELEEFKNNVGQCVECLGFLSTSKQLKVAKKFALTCGSNVLIKVEVEKLERNWQLDWGFAYIEEFTTNPGEDQVLFNMLNSFLIKSVEFNKQQNWTQITLQYGVAARVSFKHKKQLALTESERRINSALGVQEQWLKKNYCQGVTIYQYNLLTQTQYYASQQYFVLEKKALECKPRNETENLQYFCNFWFRAQLYITQGKYGDELNKIMEQTKGVYKQFKEKIKDQEVYKLLYYDIQRIKAEALTATQKYHESLAFNNRILQQLKSYATQNHIKQKQMAIFAFSLFKFQCLVGLKKMDQALVFMQELQKKLESIKDFFPQIYESARTLERNSCYMNQQNETEKMKKMKYVINQLCDTGRSSKKMLASLFEFGLKYVTEYSQSGMKDEQKFCLLRIQKIMFEVDQLMKQGKRQSGELEQKINYLLNLLKAVPDKFKGTPCYGLGVLYTSKNLFQLFRFKQSLQLCLLCLEVKRYISDIQHLQNLGRICKLKIGFNEQEEALKIKKQLEEYEMFEEIGECLKQIQCLLALKRWQKDKQQQLSEIYDSFGQQTVFKTVYLLEKIEYEMDNANSNKAEQAIYENQAENLSSNSNHPSPNTTNVQNGNQNGSMEEQTNNWELIETAKQLVSQNQYEAAIVVLQPISDTHLESQISRDGQILAGILTEAVGDIQHAKNKYEQSKALLLNYPFDNLQILQEIHDALSYFDSPHVKIPIPPPQPPTQPVAQLVEQPHPEILTTTPNTFSNNGRRWGRQDQFQEGKDCQCRIF